VFTMGECSLCRKKARDDVFLDHVSQVASYVRKNFDATPIIWDDMLRHLQADQLKKISELVEPMVWVYAENVYHFVTPVVSSLLFFFNLVLTRS
jgi:hexosaminidase